MQKHQKRPRVNAVVRWANSRALFPLVFVIANVRLDFADTKRKERGLLALVRPFSPKFGVRSDIRITKECMRFDSIASAWTYFGRRLTNAPIREALERVEQRAQLLSDLVQSLDRERIAAAAELQQAFAELATRSELRQELEGLATTIESLRQKGGITGDDLMQALQSISAAQERLRGDLLAVNKSTESAMNAPLSMSADDFRALERKGLFVIGSGRSGTTILANCLNFSSRIHLLEEPDLFLNYARRDFVNFFNDRHQRYENLLRKGAYIPPSLGCAEDGFEFLRRMGEAFDYVGEKVAVGPRPNSYPDDWHTRCFDFYARYFYGATYFMTLRRPAEVALSMSKKWPTIATTSFLECWLVSLDFLLDVYLAFEHTYLSFFDRFTDDTMAAAARILGVTIDFPNGTIAPENVASALPTGELPDFLAPHAELCTRCDELYRRLRDAFCDSTLRYCGPRNYERFFQDVKHNVAALLDELRGASIRRQDDAA
jgi:hypothetical protein